MTLWCFRAFADPVIPTTMPTTGPFKLKIAALNETRAHNFFPVKFIVELGLKLTLRANGPASPDQPTAYGDWHVRQAVDDRGTDLRPPPPPPAATQPVTAEQIEKALENARDEVGSNARYTAVTAEPAQAAHISESATDCSLRLGLPSRAATMIARLSGDFTIYTGRPVTITFTKLKQSMNRPLENPALQQAGITIEIVDPANVPKDQQPNLVNSAGPSILLHCRGQLRAFGNFPLDVSLADGSSAEAGFSSVPDPDKTDDYDQLSLSRPLDDSMVLKVALVLNRQPVKVPFDLFDIPLH